MTAKPARPWGLRADGERPRSSHKGHPSSGLLEIEAQQAEHQASQASLASSQFALLVTCTLNLCNPSAKTTALKFWYAQQAMMNIFKWSATLHLRSDVMHLLLQLRAQAKQCLIKHDFEQAEQLLSQGLQLTPGSYKLLRLRSVAYACLQQYRPSLKACPHYYLFCLPCIALSATACWHML